jgi:hypothetical protein
MSSTSNRTRASLEKAVLSMIQNDPSSIHKMPSCAWDATNCVVDSEWRFLSCIGGLNKSDGRCFALWYAGVFEGCIALYRSTRT